MIKKPKSIQQFIFISISKIKFLFRYLSFYRSTRSTVEIEDGILVIETRVCLQRKNKFFKNDFFFHPSL